MWVFHSELIHIFLLCRNVPLVKTNGSRVSFGDFRRIERHSFDVSFEPIETKVAYRILCGVDVVSRPRVVNGGDTVVNNDDTSGGANVPNVSRPSTIDDEELHEALLDGVNNAEGHVDVNDAEVNDAPDLADNDGGADEQNMDLQ